MAGRFHNAWLLAMAAFAVIAGCSTPRKLRKTTVEEKTISIQLPPQERHFREINDEHPQKDTLVVKDLEGNEITLMETIIDEDGNEMAHETLQAAKVTARFRNVAERGGRVLIEFETTIPMHLIDTKWQLRFYPEMYIQEDTLDMEPLLITGRSYREAQLRGYELYNRFINTIISDSTEFLRLEALEVFLQRNIPEVFQFKTDSSYVSEEVFYSHYGLTQQEVVKHYTRKWKVGINDRKENRRQKMYKRLVKSPIEYDGVRLDSIVNVVTGDITYVYSQSFESRPKLRKVDVVLSGEIYDYGKKIYTIPPTEKLTFYISSLNAFTRDIIRYKTRVIERKAEANTSADLSFTVGKWEIEEKLDDNAKEISKIKNTLVKLVNNEEFDIDSIVVSAAASPEGYLSDNKILSQRRAESVSKFFSEWVRIRQDSLLAERGFKVDEDGNIIKEELTPIHFASHERGEDWIHLTELVDADTVMTLSQKKDFYSLLDKADLDQRERLMQTRNYYSHMRNNLYPQLRRVRFNFHLHRKGMVKDTVHTTVLDSTYMYGVQLLRDFDYDAALEILRPYKDYNTAVVYCATGRNQSALQILEKLERDAQVNYMLAVIYSRENRFQEAVQCYMHACAQDPSYVHRGNLDPEISLLIDRYGVNKEDEFDYDIF